MAGSVETLPGEVSCSGQWNDRHLGPLAYRARVAGVEIGQSLGLQSSTLGKSRDESLEQAASVEPRGVPVAVVRASARADWGVTAAQARRSLAVEMNLVALPVVEMMSM